MSHMKRFVLVVVGLALLCASVYFAMGVLQAASLFTGEKALWNANLWGALSLVSVFCALLAFYRSVTNSSKNIVYSIALVRICSAAFILLALYMLFPILADYLAANKCVAHGGSYNYVASVCEDNQSNNYIAIYRRSGFRVVVACLLILLSAHVLHNSSGRKYEKKL